MLTVQQLATMNYSQDSSMSYGFRVHACSTDSDADSIATQPPTPMEFHQNILANADDSFGDDLEEQRSPDHLRIYFQNINGLKWDKDGGNWAQICTMAGAINADIVALAELNHDTNRYAVRNKMDKVSKKHFDTHRFAAAASPLRTRSTYKPGGTAILTTRSLVGFVKQTMRDRMGRWTAMRYSGRQGTHVTVISAYQVCAGKVRPGSITAANQQQSQITLESIKQGIDSRVAPRNAFIQDLQSFIHEWQTKGDDIILLGDFNEDMASENSGIARLAQDCHLVDVFQERFHRNDAPATFRKGPRRIDFALVSQRVSPLIKLAGYDPFGYRLPSDHRGFFLDLDIQALLHSVPTPLSPLSQRDFNTRQPGVIVDYVRAKVKYLDDHNFSARLQNLQESVAPNHPLAEALDRDLTRAAEHAAKHCARRKTTPWSPKFAEAWAHLHYYKVAKSALVNLVDYTAALNKLRSKWKNLPETVPTHLPAIHSGYKAAQAKLREARSEAQAYRDEFLEAKSALYAALGDQGKQWVVDRLKRAEEMSRVHSKIDYLCRDDTSAGLSELKVPVDRSIIDPNAMKRLPDTSEYWETVRVPKDIETMLLERNRRHFGQAEGTPFTLPQVTAAVHYQGTGLAADMMLDGEAHIINATAATKLFVDHLQRKTLSELPAEITEEEFLGKLKHWPEKTSTSPSGLHLGHYHAAWRDCGLDGDNPIRSEVEKGQAYLRRIHVALLNYSLKFGYSFERWSNVVNVMLQKDPGNPRIHRLRVIHLYEADYNLLLAVKWRQAMHHAEDERLLNDGLYGSRSGRSAHDPVFVEVLQHEIYKWSMKLGLNFDLDATSCYDRILACLATICSRRVGMAKSVVMVNASTLEEAKFKIKTQLGVSEAWYRHCHIFPIHGTGQGSGNSPHIWCFVCSVLFDAFAAKAHGATFSSYDRTRQLQLFMVGFVDDCSQRVNVFDAHPQPSVHHLVQLMTRDAQLWNDLLWASGGALEHSKCSFHCVDFLWTTAGEPFHRPNQFAPPVTLHHQGVATSIHQMSNYRSHKTLGCYVNPAGLPTAQLQVLKKKNEEFARLLESNYFSPHEARTMYWSIYIPSMTYPLSVIPLPESDCNDLDTRFMKVIVPRCGYGRTMHRAIRYGPYILGGSTFKRTYVEMGALLLQMSLKFFNHPDTQPGCQLYIALSWFQAFLGVSFSILEFPARPIPPCGNSLFTVIQQFLASVDGQIVLKTPHVPPLLRINDRHLMDVALDDTRWKPIHMRHIQACRRFLQVQTIADVTDMDGTHLRGNMLDSSRPPQPTDVRVSMFNQPCPDAISWTIWRTFLRTFSTIRGELNTPLGHWTVPLDQCRHWPQWAYNSAEDRLFRHVTNSSYRSMTRKSTRRFDYTHTGKPEAPPPSTSPIRVTVRHDLLVPSLASGNPTAPVADTVFVTFDKFISSLPAWEHELLKDCHLLVPPSEIMQFLNQDGGGSCGSDGSVKHLAATFGFVLAHSLSRTLLAKGRGPAPGAKPNSFRSESYGLLAVLRFLIRLIEYTGTPLTVAPIVYLDNSSVVKRSNRATTQKYTVPNCYLLSEWDVIQSIAESSNQLPFPLEIRWVKGHQDDEKPRRSLPFPAQLNCLADDEATNAAAEYPVAPLIPPLLPPVHAMLILQGESVTSKLKKRIHYAANAPALFEYLERRFQWSPATRKTIDFQMFSQISKAFQDKRTTLVKHCHAIAPTGHIANRNNPSYPRCCPACPCVDESNNHVLQCPGPSRNKWRIETINAIRKYRPSYSDPALIRLLCAGLDQFHQDLPGSPTADTIYLPASHHQLQAEQDAIGWDQLYRGRWSSQWELMHNQYSTTQPLHLQQSGSKWVLGLGRLLLTQWFKLWKIRNDERHGVDAETRESARLQVVQHQLAALYLLRTKVCPCDRHIFLANPEIHLQLFPDLQTIEDWINLYSEAIHASVTRATALRIGNTPAIDEVLRQLTPSSADAL